VFHLCPSIDVLLCKVWDFSIVAPDAVKNVFIKESGKVELYRYTNRMNCKDPPRANPEPWMVEWEEKEQT